MHRRFIIKPMLVLLLFSLISPISPTIAQAEPSATIDGFSMNFGGAGVSFFIDLTIKDMVDQEAKVLVWFRYAANNEYVTNAGWDEDFTTPSGYLAVSTAIDPIYETSVWALDGGNAIELVVPYNQFPSADYDYYYYPQIAIYNPATEEFLANVAYEDRIVTVKGSEAPNSFRVWFQVTDLHQIDGAEDCCVTSSGSDEVYVLYAMSHLTADDRLAGTTTGGWGPYDMEAGDRYDGDYFDPLMLDIPANGQGIMVYLAVYESEDPGVAADIVEAAGLVAGVGGIAGLAIAASNPATATALGVFAAAAFIADVVVTYGSDDLVIIDVSNHHDNGDLRDLAETHNSQWHRWNGSGTNFLDDYEYEVEYTLWVNAGYRHELRRGD